MDCFFIDFRDFGSGFDENSDFVKNNTPLKREHDFQGSGGSGNTTFLLFFGVWFLDWLGDRFLWILAPF